MNTLVEKLEYLSKNHFSEWLKTRQEVEHKLSDSQEMFCICGKLATGLHESTCRRFNNKVTNETVKILWDRLGLIHQRLDKED